MSIRAEKVASVIKKVIAKPISEIAHKYTIGLVTVTSVKLSNDLQIAKVYISVYGNKISKGELLSHIENNISGIRYLVGKEVRLRYTPEIKIYLDDTLDEMEHIQDLIDKTKKNTSDVKLNMEDYDEKYFPKND